MFYRGGGINPDNIILVKRWTASGWRTYEYNGQNSSNQRNQGSETFTIPSDGLYLFVWGGNPGQLSNTTENKLDCFSLQDGWTPIGSDVSAYTLRPEEDQSLPITGISTVYYKKCKAGETYTFDWSVSRWNKTGGTVANLILIKT